MKLRINKEIQNAPEEKLESRTSTPEEKLESRTSTDQEWIFKERTLDSQVDSVPLCEYFMFILQCKYNSSQVIGKN